MAPDEQITLPLDDERAVPSTKATAARRRRNTDQTFFEQKRDWSRVKDRLIAKYLPAYLPKVARLRPQVVLIDAFAGPGMFGTGDAAEPGSPLLIAQAARRIPDLKYRAYFINKLDAHHRSLRALLKDDRNVVPVHGQAQKLMRVLSTVVGRRTVWLYLDPFGLAGCEMDNFRRFLERDPRTSSTEIVVNLNTPEIHRLGTARAIRLRRETPQTRQYNARLTQVLGGDYWRSILLDTTLTPQQQDEAIVERYLGQFHQYLSFAGHCRVADAEGHTKYHITFCSRHPDALLLMNNAMLEAYWRVRAEMSAGTIFAALSWERLYKEQNTELFPRADLERDVMEAIQATPHIEREALCVRVVERRFMAYRQRDIEHCLLDLVNAGRILVTGGQKVKGRLNGKCTFVVAP